MKNLISERNTNKMFGIFAWLLTLLVLIPVYLVIINSIKSAPESVVLKMTLPRKFMFGNYIEAIKRGNLIRAFFNSLYIAGVSATISNIFSAMCAFVISRNRTRFNKFVYNFIFLGLIAPFNYITLIKVLQVVGLNNTQPGVILVFATLGLPFSVFLFYGFISGVPKELDEAAIIDGAKLNTLFFRIILPLLKPVFITGFVMNFMGAWNDFITNIYILSNNKKMGMVLAIYNFFGLYFNEWNMIYAVIVLTILPILVLYIFGQRYIITGMVSGSVKG